MNGQLESSSARDATVCAWETKGNVKSSVIARYTGEQYARCQWLQAEVRAARLDLFSADPLDREQAREWIQSCVRALHAVHAAAEAQVQA